MYYQKSVIKKPLKDIISTDEKHCIIKKTIENNRANFKGVFTIISELEFYALAIGR